MLSEDVDIAEKFNSFLTEIGERLRENISSSSFDPLQLIPNIKAEMNLESTTEEEIISIVQGLNNVGPGADSISSKIFKLSYQVIMRLILHLFNTCLESGIFPSTLKVAIIKPIFKSGDCHLINNYRPISILPFVKNS